MKAPSVGIRILTPAVGLDQETERRKKQAEATNAASMARTYTGGGSAAPSFEALLQETNAYYTPETVDYRPLSEATLRTLLEGKLRPAYDSAIGTRRERTQSYNAALDADAWARGMGQSTYLTDVKQRSYRDESRDIGQLEASYGATLADALLNALAEQTKNKLEVDQFNAEQINEARARAYSAATALYAASQKGGGSGGGSRAASVKDPATPASQTLLDSLTTAPVYDRVETPEENVAISVLDRLNGSARQKLYDAQTPKTARLLAEMTKSLGPVRMKNAAKKYSLAH